MGHRRFRQLIAIGTATALAATGLGACSSTSTESTSTDRAEPSPTQYQPGTKSTAMSHPPNPVIAKLTYTSSEGTDFVVAPVTTVAGSNQDAASATLVVYPTMTSRQRMPKPIYTATKPIGLGSDRVSFALPKRVVDVVDRANPIIADQLVEVSVQQKVDGDADGTFEGSVNARKSYHDSQIDTAGETVDITIGTNVANVNLATTPIVCMYNDSSSSFAPLSTTLTNIGDYVSSSIEADGDLFDSPQYGGPPWPQIASTLTVDAAIDIARYILSALSPVNVAVQAVIDIISLGIDDCDSQASIFQITAASSASGDTTNQAYVASEQTSNGLLSAATAAQWQANMQAQGGTVWQESVSNQYLNQMAGASADNGLSISATNNSVGDLTLSSSWTFMVNQGGTSSIPNGCDDKGCP